MTLVYKKLGTHAVITIKDKECLVDIDILEKLLEMKVNLTLNKSKNSNSTYVAFCFKGKVQYLHRFIMDTPKGLVVDHEDHNGLNNLRSNLKNVTRSKNGLHRKTAAKHNKSSGIQGVSYNKVKRKYQAYISIERRKKSLGYYDNPQEAAEKVKAFRKSLLA